MTETLQLFGTTLPVAVWTAIISVSGAILAAVIGGSALLAAQWVGRQNLKMQIERDDRALKAQMERDDRVLASEVERDDRKRLQEARLRAYEAFFEKADLWSAIMTPDGRRHFMSYEDIKRLQNELIAASAPARLVAPAATVKLMIGYLSYAAQWVLFAASDPTGTATKALEVEVEKQHGKLTDAARIDVGNSDGSIALMYQRVQ